MQRQAAGGTARRCEDSHHILSHLVASSRWRPRSTTCSIRARRCCPQISIRGPAPDPLTNNNKHILSIVFNSYIIYLTIHSSFIIIILGLPRVGSKKSIQNHQALVTCPNHLRPFKDTTPRGIGCPPPETGRIRQAHVKKTWMQCKVKHMPMCRICRIYIPNCYMTYMTDGPFWRRLCWAER